jgi:hypothetical protein
MKTFFSNIWTKRAASLLSGFYCFAVCFLCYCSLYYSIEIGSNITICLLATGISLLFLIAMIYSRKQIITRIVSVVLLPAMLPVVLFYFGQWYLIIPIVATSLVIFLLSGLGEGAKTAFGTAFLLIYIFGSLGYFLVTSLFMPSTNKKEVALSVSPSKLYRCSVVNVNDSSKGSTSVYVEPNDKDYDFKFVKFKLHSLERTVHMERPINANVKIEWAQKTRQEITTELNALSPNIIVHLKESQLEALGYTYNDKLKMCDLTAHQYNLLGLPNGSDVYLSQLTDEQLALFKIAKDKKGYYLTKPCKEILDDMHKDANDKIYFQDMSSAWKSEYCVEKDDSVLLSSLTDENLAMLGVPENGDVLYYNGEVCFRYYVAILEDYFDFDNKTVAFL